MTFALLVKGALVLARISGVLLLMPVFSTTGVPRLARGLAALFLTIVVAPVVPGTPIVQTLPLLVGGMVSEFIVGMAMGSAVYIAFTSISIGAEVMSGQMGLGAANWFDPLFKSNQTAMGRILYWLAAMIFLGTNLHLAMIQAVADSFQSIPPGAVVQPGMLAIGWPQLISATMAVGVRLAGPVVVLVFLIQSFLAILARLASAMNSFMSIGLILTMSAGYIIIWLSLPGMLRAHLEFIESVVPLLVPIANQGRAGG